MNTGQCPGCKAVPTKLKAEKIDIAGAKAIYVGVTYVCPHCHTIMGAGLDPLLLKADIVKDVLAGLKR